jgi:putative nucleotidyltransferase with HDIG domain
MNRITIVAESVTCVDDLKVELAPYFEVECLCLNELRETPPGEFTFVDVNLKDPAKISSLKRWLVRRPTNGQVIFGVNQKSRLESTQAFAVGATGLLPRPVDGRRLSMMLSTGNRSIAKNPADPASETCEGIAASVSGLKKMFAAAMLGEALDMKVLNAAAGEIVERIEEDGLAYWLDIVRRYHSQTYQHCLIVTAVAVSFGRHLGFSNADKQRLASAALVHDIGKALIPIHILEKPAQLSEEETAVMRTHPELGFEALRHEQGLPAEMLDMVLHHHEYLDGSGYPHGLGGNEISDLVRTMTIADIYGALIERRPYRSPSSGADAYQILIDMGPKLDKDLVRIFRPLARSVG